MDDGTIKTVGLQNLDFAPNTGDQVEIYEGDGALYVLKKTPQFNGGSGVNFGNTRDNTGLQININNSNSSNNSNNNINNNEKNENEKNGRVKEKKRVKKVVYILLAIFLGLFGVHKFYAGKTSSGVLYIVFIWTCIPWIISFFEGIAAIFMKADSEDTYMFKIVMARALQKCNARAIIFIKIIKLNES